MENNDELILLRVRDDYMLDLSRIYKKEENINNKL